jgi:hypothetical protein
MAGQWPWAGEEAGNLFTVILPALLWAGISIALLRRKLTLEPWIVLANVAVFVVFLPTPIAVDYGSLGRASIAVVLAALVTLPQACSSLEERSRLIRGSLLLWSLPFWIAIAIPLNALGPKYIW